MSARREGLRLGVALWGVGGIVALLIQALLRLSPRAAEAFSMELGPAHWLLLAIWIPFMAYAEGYRGFQQRFSPRAVKRAWHLARHPSPGLVVVAPLFAMGLVHSTRRRKIASWALLLGIVGLILMIRLLAQPWRGLIDAGVVVGLSWGMGSLLWYAGQALMGREPEVDPELPG